MEKSYYAIIPATVRYDKKIPAGAKLLYGEITALCNEKGFCWASNQYFADLYNISPSTVKRWISELESNNYIIRNYSYREGTKEVDNRCITIRDTPAQNCAVVGAKMSCPPVQNCALGGCKNEPENNKEDNVFNNYYTREEKTEGDKPSSKKHPKFVPPTLDEVAAYCKKRGNSVDPKRFFDYYNEAEWVDSTGKPVKSWKQKMIANWENSRGENNPPRKELPYLERPSD